MHGGLRRACRVRRASHPGVRERGLRGSLEVPRGDERRADCRGPRLFDVGRAAPLPGARQGRQAALRLQVVLRAEARQALQVRLQLQAARQGLRPLLLGVVREQQAHQGLLERHRRGPGRRLEAQVGVVRACGRRGRPPRVRDDRTVQQRRAASMRQHGRLRRVRRRVSRGGLA